ncbi:MAG: hypothetical protein JOY79_00305 [Acidobacteriaceae bacterium]|nr:hypothetical protein [Acidobacteriaceae bacterium]
MVGSKDFPPHVSIVYREGVFHAVCLRCGTFLGISSDIVTLKLAEQQHQCKKPSLT